MPFKNLLVDMKRNWFDSIRKRRMSRLIGDLDNYLSNVEIIRGVPDTKSNKILVLSPHPDDESLGCGGTLALLSSTGKTIDVCYVTSGFRAGDQGSEETRIQEAETAAKILGINSVTCFGGKDGEVHQQPWITEKLQTILQTGEYQTIFSPWAYDGHSDHMATFKLLSNAIQNVGLQAQIWLYEIWSPVVANRIIDIDSTIELKKKAIKAYTSQLSQIDYVRSFVALAEYRSLICRPAKYAEAFFCCDSNALKKTFRSKA